jgi:hypothetical protein
MEVSGSGRTEIVQLLIDAMMVAHRRHIESMCYNEWEDCPLDIIDFVIAPMVENPLDAQDDYVGDNQGRTALMAAALAGHVDVVRLLVTAGASTEIEDHSGDNVRHLVEHSAWLSPERKDAVMAALNPLPLPRNPECFCGICQEHDGGQYVLCEPCGHYFHKGCAQRVLAVNHECPTCHARVEFAEKTFSVSAQVEEEKK